MTVPQVPPTQPADPPGQGSVMYFTYASNVWIIALTVASVLATVAVLYSVVQRWPTATSQIPSAPAVSASASAASAADSATQGQTGIPGERFPSERDVLIMIILMGTLGGLVHLTSSLAQYVGNRQLYRSWIIYYLLMPVEGAALAPMLYVLIRAGVLIAPSGGSGQSTANLNVVVLYGFAGLTGLFSKQAIEKLADVFAVIFKRVQARDSIKQAESPGRGGGAGAP